MSFFINGKFLAQRTTGVQRFAAEALNAIDLLLSKRPQRTPPVLLHPPQVDPPALRYVQTRSIGRAGNLHLWEQTSLPWASRDSLLVNLGGTAPLLHRNQLVTLFDAAIFDYPEAYTRAFRTWYQFAFIQLWRNARSIVTTSEFSKQRLTANLGATNRCRVVTCGVDHIARVAAEPAVIDRLGLTRGGFLLAVGSANPTKNFGRLIEAFARVSDRVGVTLVIVGGMNNAVFKNDLARTGDSAIVHAGTVSDGELKALYQHALAFIFPSLYEGFGFPPLEAMECGCPVLAADAASIPEVCGDAALYFDPHDTAALAVALVEIAGNKSVHDRLKAAAPVRAARFRWADVAVELSALIDSIDRRA